MARAVCVHCLRIFFVRGPGTFFSYNNQIACCDKCATRERMFLDTYSDRFIDNGDVITDLNLWLKRGK